VARMEVMAYGVWKPGLHLSRGVGSPYYDELGMYNHLHAWVEG
jgi:hypothetical protein